MESSSLIEAYHALIDLEYEKYKRSNESLENAWFTRDEALRVISNALSIPISGAKNVIDKLFEKRFIIELGENRFRTLHFDVAYRASNITIEYGSLRYPLEARIYVRDEEIPKFDDYKFNDLESLIDHEVYKILEFALSRDVNPREKDRIQGFSSFQLRAIREIMHGRKRAYILLAPTSGGKTYAFLIPALVRVLEGKLQGKNKGVKAILIYPRRTLERDQLNKILTIIHRVNYYLKQVKGLNTKVTVGIDDGETPWERNIRSQTSFRGASCPSCGGELEYFASRISKTVRCRNCGYIYDWIYSYREQIWSQKPDILITNVWALDFRLPSKTIEYDHAVYRDASMIILDEAHVYQSLLGGNIRYLLKRLKLATSNEPIIVLSSATISKPEDFGRDILDMEPRKDFTVIEAEKKRAKKKVIYLIMAVHPQRSWETAVYELALLLATVFKYRGLQSVVFIDSIRELHRIYNQMLKVAALYYREPKDHFDPNIVNNPGDPYNYQVYMKSGDMFNPSRTPDELLDYIKIHYSGVQNREKIEKDFTSGRLGVLLSTSTLELGVDYPNVSIVTTVGVPFMLESIPQRIGRAGRNPVTTLNTTLAIIILRNTPMELYYMYKPEDLVEGFRNKNIPVAWRNIAVKKYHSLFTVFDEMARNGEYTYILRTDGRLHDLTDFINKITEYIDKVKNKLRELDTKTEVDADPPTKVIEEVKKELQTIPHRLDDWREAHESALKAHEALVAVRKVALLVYRMSRRTGDRELAQESGKILRLIWKVLIR
ncbi:MAG: DEAD/DEAH box helicase [Caldisphaeraceae archaeon]|nr:DEAD/DEAH box helicase [Desulfurococcales archaeon]MEB3797196.1 DEAD/DEAH box helicase [Caldisphaeraceae archaeon]